MWTSFGTIISIIICIIVIDIMIISSTIIDHFPQIQQWVTDIVNDNSDILTHFLLGYSYEGRAVNGFKVMNEKLFDESALLFCFYLNLDIYWHDD